MNKYVLDKDFNLKKVTRSVWGILWTCLKWIVATVSLAAFSYLIFSFVLNTEEEKRLKQENRMYEKLYPEMQKKERLVSEVIKDLQARDEEIYKRIFNMQAPSADPQNSALFVFASDSVGDKDIVEYAERKASALTGNGGQHRQQLQADLLCGKGWRPRFSADAGSDRRAEVRAGRGFGRDEDESFLQGYDNARGH